ncbi:MAG: VUT family protein, partial [Bacteroidota bacterium]
MNRTPDRSWPLPKIILFLVLGFVFLTHALLAEFIGVKIFSLNDLLGWKKDGVVGDMNLTAGVLLWPVVFVMTDLINEYFGR